MNINNHILKSLTAGCVLAVCVACSGESDQEPDAIGLGSEKEAFLKAAIEPYINNTVIPTYKGMADNAVMLSEACNSMREAFVKGNLTTELVVRAGEYWNLSREYWEKSEAFLFGAAADYNIDPHIDSWPLDKNAMEQLLTQLKQGYAWNVENLGYGLLGFHAVEYMLFELSNNGTKSTPHNINYAPEELIYLCGVAEDLRNQCVYLEAAWAGMDNVSLLKQQILEEAELKPSRNYGWMMLHAGSAGSTYKTYQEAAEELIQGCIDIADEVGNTKIGRPHMGASEDDRNYIESPYSLNSTADFAGNIESVKNAYCGSNPGDASVSDFIKSVNPDLDRRLRKQIEISLSVIKAIPEPFASSAKGDAAGQAVIVVGSELVDILEDVMTELSKQ